MLLQHIFQKKVKEEVRKKYFFNVNEISEQTENN